MKKPIINLLLKGAKRLPIFTSQRGRKRTPLIALALFAFGAMVQQQCKCKIEEQFNNANAEPEFLEVKIEPCQFADEFYAPCWETPGHIDANVTMEVRTGSYNANATPQFTPDPTPYDEIDVDRYDMSCSISNPNNKFTLEVPKTGAYALIINIRSMTCSYCCWGAGDTQCGTPPPVPVPGSSQYDYTAGRPRWVVEKVFVAGSNRPWQ